MCFKRCFAHAFKTSTIRSSDSRKMICSICFSKDLQLYSAETEKNHSERIPVMPRRIFDSQIIGCNQGSKALLPISEMIIFWIMGHDNDRMLEDVTMRACEDQGNLFSGSEIGPSAV